MERISASEDSSSLSTSSKTQAFVADMLAQVDRGVQTQETFVRPKGPINRLMFRGLGPLPKGMKVVDGMSLEPLFVRSWHRVIGGLGVAIIWVSVMILMTMFPWMIMSPVSVVLHIFQGGDVTTGSSVVTYIMLGIIIASVIASLVWRKPFTRFLLQMAYREEACFRAGTEKWSVGQRVYSCLIFGVAHIFNLIYPIGVLIVLMIAGMLFSLVYMRVYKKTDDIYQATLASTRVHAMYNQLSLYWVAGVLAVLLTLQLVL